jgi:hypothetical protein
MPAGLERNLTRDLMRSFPADLMRMWAISTRVNKPENDDPSIVEPIRVATDAAQADAPVGVTSTLHSCNRDLF